jgi:hypothetical protein
MRFGVAPLDPLTFAVVIGLLSLTAVAAIAGPAWKATRIDPVEAHCGPSRHRGATGLQSRRHQGHV